MEKTQSLEEFYRAKQLAVPANLQRETGHFNVFERKAFAGAHAQPLPYSRKDFYKITFITGQNRFFYADKTIEVEKHALLFTNPQVPYQCEQLSDEQDGFFCIFTDAFFHPVKVLDYPVFRPGGQPLLFLPDDQVPPVQEIFEKMMKELHSDYPYKFDLLKLYTIELVHIGMKMQPFNPATVSHNASSRISSLFTDLLERQFPIESPVQQVNLRTTVDFATQLSIHVNHLNKALKDTTGKSTSALIAKRIVQEAKTL